MNRLAYLLLTLWVFSAFAGDDRFGVATHFQQGWSTNLMPSIKALGVGYIRDNDNGTIDSLGHYVPPAWLGVALANGLKVVLIVGNNDDTSFIVGRCVAIAAYGKVAAVEIINEPNNITVFQGTVGEQKLVTLSNTVATAVRATGSKMQVIGLGEQGSEILYMLRFHRNIDGLVYHPYFSIAGQSGSVYEPPYFKYVEWVNKLRATTTSKLWETEWGTWGSLTNSNPLYSYASQASLIIQRLALTQSLKIEHTFIYEFKDNGTEKFGLCDNAGKPKPSYYAVQHFIATQPKVGNK